MREKYLRFGEFIRKKRLDDPRELTMPDVAFALGISYQYVSEVEKGRRNPFDKKKLELLAEFLDFSEEETALMYDLASRENHGVPYDIEDTLMYEDVGDLARFALRQSKAGFIKEQDWKAMIRKAEARKAKQKNKGGNDDV